MIRGDDDLFSTLDQMSDGGMHGGERREQNMNKNTNSQKQKTQSIRMEPEQEGYGNEGTCVPDNGHGGSIWNPYVAVHINISSTRNTMLFAPTSPYVEVARRRAYEKFKTKFYQTFNWAAANSQAHAKQQLKNNKSEKKEGFDFSTIWNKSPHSILERFYFASKVEETFIAIANTKNGALSIPNISPNAEVSQIAKLLSTGKENGLIIDPILIAPFQRHKAAHELLRNEIKFQLKREYKKATKGKDPKALDGFFDSKSFQKKFSKTSRGINDAAIEAEDDFLGDLKKKVAQMASSHQSHKRKKKGIPKLSHGHRKEKDSDDVVESICLTYSGLSFRISKLHFAKLQILFDRHNRSSVTLQEHRDSFYCALFTLLTRYDLLEGGGLQSSLNGNVFDVLLKHFNCNTECFASPLNCRYERFCSAFEDTDVPFGSLGSFFNLNFEQLPDGGCFQANPPFASDFILQMCNRIEKVLSDHSLPPFMFIVFVPAWQESQGWQALSNASSLIHHLFLSQKDDVHYYCEGTQHRRLKGRYRVASFDTSVFFMQNQAGKKKWPITEEMLQQLKDAFGSNPEDTEKHPIPSPLPIDGQKKSERKDSHKSKEMELALRDGKKRIRHTSQSNNGNGDGNGDTSRRKRKAAHAKSGKKSKAKKKLIDDSDAKGQMAILSALGIATAATCSNQTTDITKKKKRKRKK